jgi:hypothetical protein
VRGPIIGDLVSVNLRDQQWDIRINTVKPAIIDGERHFTHEDYASVCRHLEHVAERGDADVFLVREQNAMPLSRFDVLRVLKFGKDDAYAIKTKDLAGLEK